MKLSIEDQVSYLIYLLSDIFKFYQITDVKNNIEFNQNPGITKFSLSYSPINTINVEKLEDDLHEYIRSIFTTGDVYVFINTNILIIFENEMIEEFYDKATSFTRERKIKNLLS